MIPLGGLGEVGKNMTVFELQGETIVDRRGARLPQGRAPRSRPDPARLRLSPGREVRAVILTHAHEDHVGALPYLLREIRVREVLATRLTLGLVKSKLDEHGLLNASELREVGPDSGPIELGPFRAGARPHVAFGARRRRRLPRDRRGPRLPHGRLEARPHARRRAPHRRRQARRARQPRRRPAARRLDQRGATRIHATRSGSSGRRSARSSPPSTAGC